MLKSFMVAGLIASSLVVQGQETTNRTVPLVPADEQSAHFAAVNRRLELGGVLYGYVDIDGDAAKLGRNLTKMFATLPVAQPQALMLKQDYAQIFADLGFADLKAVGFSSVKAGAGFRNHTFFYIPGGRHGLLAALGGAPAPFTDLQYAPPDTDLFLDGEVDLPVAYAAIKTVVGRMGGAAAVNAMEAALQRPKQGSGISPLEIIQKLSGHVTAVLRLDPAHPIPLRGPLPVSVPGVSFFIRADGVGPSLAALLVSHAKLVHFWTEGGITFYENTTPSPVSGFQLATAFQGRTLYLASSLAFLKECLKGKETLAQNPDLRQALAVLGTEGNGLTYASPRLLAELKQTLQAAAAKAGPGGAMLALWADNVPVLSFPLVSVRINEPDGILFNSYLNRSLKQDIMVAAIYNPVTLGLMAAMAVPAFQKVRQASQEKAVLNNLRQLSAAADQYMLEHGVNQADYSDLVGPDKYIKELHPVAGEDYTSIVIHMTDAEVEVRLPSGQVVRLRR